MKERERTIHEVRKLLQRHASPRLHMVSLVAVTGACGLLSSYVLLNAGLTAMAIRYPIAVGLAYLAFLGLIAIWLRRFRLHAKSTSDQKEPSLDFDLVELPVDAMWNVEPRTEFGGAGGFSGGGATGSWTESAGSTAIVRGVASRPTTGPARGGGDGWGFDFDFGDGAMWLLLVTIIAALALSVVTYVVYISPGLLAELLLDAGLAAGLYRRLAGIERRSWLSTAIRRTVIPAVLVAGLLAVAGSIMQHVYPDTVSVGGVAHRVLNSSRQTSRER